LEYSAIKDTANCW